MNCTTLLALCQLWGRIIISPLCADLRRQNPYSTSLAFLRSSAASLQFKCFVANRFSDSLTYSSFRSEFNSECTRNRLLVGCRPDLLGKLTALPMPPSWIQRRDTGTGNKRKGKERIEEKREARNGGKTEKVSYRHFFPTSTRLTISVRSELQM